MSESEYPLADHEDNMAVAEMFLNPQSPFEWKEEDVDLIFGKMSMQAKRTLLVEKAQTLPFHVKLGKVYIVNPSDESSYPFWLAKVVGQGNHSPQFFLLPITFV